MGAAGAAVVSQRLGTPDGWVSFWIPPKALPKGRPRVKTAARNSTCVPQTYEMRRLPRHLRPAGAGFLAVFFGRLGGHFTWNQRKAQSWSLELGATFESGNSMRPVLPWEGLVLDSTFVFSMRCIQGLIEGRPKASSKNSSRSLRVASLLGLRKEPELFKKHPSRGNGDSSLGDLFINLWQGPFAFLCRLFSLSWSNVPGKKDIPLRWGLSCLDLSCGSEEGHSVKDGTRHQGSTIPLTHRHLHLPFASDSALFHFPPVF